MILLRSKISANNFEDMDEEEKEIMKCICTTNLSRFRIQKLRCLFKFPGSNHTWGIPATK